MIPRIAVITTYNRPHMALDCIESLGTDADMILVIDNGDEKPMPLAEEAYPGSSYARYEVSRVPGQPVNLSALWNFGLDWTSRLMEESHHDQWDVAIINDDVILQPMWFSQLQEAMRNTTAVAACFGPVGMLHQTAQAVPLHMRMTGWAFILRGEAGVRADERLTWWFGDDMLDWTAREMGGMLMVPGQPPENRLPNGLMTPQRHEQAAKDAATFNEIWGRMPW